MNQVIIVIPVYKEVIDTHEEISLEQCFKILRNYPVALVCANDFDVSLYVDLAEKMNKSLLVERFKKDFFESIQGYNKLMLSVNFYKRFRKYEYLLIHQTDAFVFRDELAEWCNMKYDYIGAPWLMDISGWLSIPGIYPKEIKLFYKVFGDKWMNKVGNGGLSLRKTKSFINNLTIFRVWAKKWTSNEDHFFSHVINILNPFFKIPPVNKSLRFSFDSLPEEALKMNGFKIPFGCHAWSRNDGHYTNSLHFWKKFISID